MTNPVKGVLGVRAHEGVHALRELGRLPGDRYESVPSGGVFPVMLIASAFSVAYRGGTSPQSTSSGATAATGPLPEYGFACRVARSERAARSASVSPLCRATVSLVRAARISFRFSASSCGTRWGFTYSR
jgi:hypothetical protein